MSTKPTAALLLPHHRLVVYRRALQLLGAVRSAHVTDASIRDQACRAARSVCLNIAEGASRTGRLDKLRVFGIARGEASEVAAALEIASLCGAAEPEAVSLVVQLAAEVYAMLTALIRR